MCSREQTPCLNVHRAWTCEAAHECLARRKAVEEPSHESTLLACEADVVLHEAAPRDERAIIYDTHLAGL